MRVPVHEIRAFNLFALSAHSHKISHFVQVYNVGYTFILTATDIEPHDIFRLIDHFIRPFSYRISVPFQPVHNADDAVGDDWRKLVT